MNPHNTPTSLPRSNTEPTNPQNVPPTSSTSSYPVPSNPLRVLSAAQRSQPAVGGVWDDINSLQGTGQNSSLPLQYQQPPPTYSQGNHPVQMPAVNSPFANVYPVGITANPYQPATNPFSIQQSQPPFMTPPMTSSFSTINSQPFGQQSFGVQQSSASLVHQPSTFDPTKQASMQVPMQIRSPSGQGFISASPNQSFPSAPGGQSQFLSQNHSPALQQYISHNPQQMQLSSNSQFMYSSLPPAQPQMAGHDASGHVQYSGMTTMQMSQQPLQQQQQQHMQIQMQMQQQQQYHQPMQQRQLGQNWG